MPAALFLLLTLVLLHFLVGLPLAVRGVTWTLMFVRNFLYPNAPASMKATEHFWSLSVEEQFYLFMPAFIYLVRSRAARLVTLFLSAGFFIGVTYSSTRWLLSYYPNERGHATELHLHAILIGCGLAVLMTIPKMRVVATRLLTPTIWVPMCLILSVSLAFGPGHAFLPFLLPATFPFVVLGTMLRPDHPITRVLEWAPFRFIGRMSYSLYLWQQLFFVLVSAPWSWLIRFPMNYLATFVCAAFSFYIIEKPLIRIGHKLSRRHRSVDVGLLPEDTLLQKAS